MHQKHYWLFSLKLFPEHLWFCVLHNIMQPLRFYDLFYRLDCIILCHDQFVKFKKKNRPSVTSTRAASTSEDAHYFQQKYCIIFGAAMQAEPLFALAVIFVLIFEKQIMEGVMAGGVKQ